MPLDVLGSTRTTLFILISLYKVITLWLLAFSLREWEIFTNINMTGIAAWNFGLNEEFLVSVIHYITLITSLPFVHTARRSYRWGRKVNLTDKGLLWKLTEPFYL